MAEAEHIAEMMPEVRVAAGQAFLVLVGLPHQIVAVRRVPTMEQRAEVQMKRR